MSLLFLTSFLFLSPPTEGCSKDTECKGDRICDAETARCVNPPVKELSETESSESLYDQPNSPNKEEDTSEEVV